MPLDVELAELKLIGVDQKRRRIFSLQYFLVGVGDVDPTAKIWGLSGDWFCGVGVGSDLLVSEPSGRKIEELEHDS